MNRHRGLAKLSAYLSISFFIVASTAASGSEAAVRSYADVQAFMKALAAKYPQTTHVFDLAISDSGRMVQGVAISPTGRLTRGLVENLVVGTHHGNEYGSTEVAKAVAASLAAAPIAGQVVYVIPVLNITGYENNNRYEAMANGQYQDPNRDYPGPCGTDGPWHLKSTTALAQFVAARNIVALATLHTYSPAVVYPWGISTHDTSTPYDDQFKLLVTAATVESHYPIGNSTEVIYPADGTFEDYTFWHHGTWSLLYELGETHSPSPAQIAEMVRVNVPGIRRALEASPRERAERHTFTGKCDSSLRRFDFRIE